MSARELVLAKRHEILDIAARHGATHVRLIGSVARGDDKVGSDVDFLVSFAPHTGLFAHAALIEDLQRLLGRKVDVASENGLRPRVRERVLPEAVAL